MALFFLKPNPVPKTAVTATIGLHRYAIDHVTSSYVKWTSKPNKTQRLNKQTRLKSTSFRIPLKINQKIKVINKKTKRYLKNRVAIASITKILEYQNNVCLREVIAESFLEFRTRNNINMSSVQFYVLGNTISWLFWKPMYLRASCFKLTNTILRLLLDTVLLTFRFRPVNLKFEVEPSKSPRTTHTTYKTVLLRSVSFTQARAGIISHFIPRAIYSPIPLYW